ncbi:UDP-glucuronosyltransferase-like protein, partial [Euroglyphus maynei]
MRKSLKIFIYTVDGVGHVNACIGLGQALLNRGHEVYFLCSLMFAGTLAKYGFKEIVFTTKQHEEANISEEQKKVHPVQSAKMVVQKFRESGLLSHGRPIDKLNCLDLNRKDSMGAHFYEETIEVHQQFVDATHREQPDLIIIDNLLVDPFIAFGKIPWAFSWSGNPTFLLANYPDIPPPCSGYPSNDRSGWDEFRDRFDRTFRKDVRQLQNKLNQHYGYPELSDDNFLFHSPHLNFYGYPKELDYFDIVERPENFIQLDAFCRETPEPFELPEEFRSKLNAGDRLIYLSLGSIGSMDVPLMKRIVQALSKTPYKYVVSRGALHEEYELAGNMWGEAFLPQIRILPLVDMVITHGGNNTVTETMSFGKPMLVMPLFADQFDNAQRIREKGFGDRIETYAFKDDELIEKIDTIINDEQIRQRCR